MKKFKYLFGILLFCLLIDVKAVNECTSEEMNRLRELANKVEFKLDYEIIDEIVDDDYDDDYVHASYKIQVINDNEDLKYYIKYSNNSEEMLVTASDFSQLKFEDGWEITIKIYAYSNNFCINELLRTMKLEFPKYNTYYHFNKEKCQKYPEFNYCKEFMNLNKEWDEIDKLFDEYINGNSNNEYSKIKFNYVYLILGSFVLIIAGFVIYILIKKNNKKEKI